MPDGDVPSYPAYRPLHGRISAAPSGNKMQEISKNCPVVRQFLKVP
ncbi:hypothetical protein LTSEMON_1036 [Salmonella enterica subsp. enterica serovar Montevideo str. S5-403]|uniref:Uncharacterized protein n=1 Tax=Salmonella enterica subsp. enterica serovar Montevideo str. S5-403 TaxID=913242 RepID=G5PZW1_SALMO|nr:hypothetical protein LTSEMON_1036 [Salmonella enterica subsp. enterica serovar Montevideo str. S5-403]